jgi:hypothetical protein
MRAVYRLRAFALSHLLPLVLGALVLRALIPVGFMPASGGTLTVMLCAPSSPGSQRTEIVEIPGAAQAPHCDYCTAPLLGGAPDFFLPGAPAPAFDSLAVGFHDEAPQAFVAARAHRPRGPPLA